jgi:hypothetical protein
MSGPPALAHASEDAAGIERANAERVGSANIDLIHDNATGFGVRVVARLPLWSSVTL